MESHREVPEDAPPSINRHEQNYNNCDSESDDDDLPLASLLQNSPRTAVVPSSIQLPPFSSKQEPTVNAIIAKHRNGRYKLPSIHACSEDVKQAVEAVENTEIVIDLEKFRRWICKAHRRNQRITNGSTKSHSLTDEHMQIVAQIRQEFPQLTWNETLEKFMSYKTVPKQFKIAAETLRQKFKSYNLNPNKGQWTELENILFVQEFEKHATAWSKYVIPTRDYHSIKIKGKTFLTSQLRLSRNFGCNIAYKWPESSNYRLQQTRLKTRMAVRCTQH